MATNTGIQRQNPIKKVLVVAPDDAMISLGRKLSAEFGFEIISTDTATQAINILKRQRIDLISPEAFMEDGGLFRFIEDVRALPAYRHTPIWVVARKPSARRLRMAGIVGQAARLCGADYFMIAYEEDVPGLVKQAAALLGTQELAC